MDNNARSLGIKFNTRPVIYVFLSGNFINIKLQGDDGENITCAKIPSINIFTDYVYIYVFKIYICSKKKKKKKMGCHQRR